MKRSLLLATFTCLVITSLVNAQTVFDPNAPLVQYNAGAALGSASKPNPDIAGVQRWVYTPTKGVSGTWTAAEVSAFKPYFINQNGNKMAFRLKYPKSYTTNPDAKYPLMLFFHGLGEAACPSNNGIYNNEKQLLVGARDFARKVEDGSFDGFLLYPQVVAENNCVENWSTDRSTKLNPINLFIDSLIRSARVDQDRIVVTGLSDGGEQVFNYLRSYPKRTAAAAPSSATTGQAFGPFVHIPIWFATGGKDSNPTPAQAQTTYKNGLAAGANIRYTLFPNGGHGIWNDHWRQPGFMQYLAQAHKANPLVFFQRYEFCPGVEVDAKLGITGDHHAYEWEKDGAIIARRISSSITILDNAAVSAFTGNEITVKQHGTYRVRFRRTSTSDWSAWSPTPAVIREKNPTVTPPIQVAGLRSKVLPAPDGSTSVPLTLPDGYDGYEWFDASTNAKLSTEQVFNAGIGEFKAQVIDTDACSSVLSPLFRVASADGSPKPEPARNLTATATSQSAIQLDWNKNPNAGNNETGFEIYRSTSPGGPYKLIFITAPNVVTYQNTGLQSNANYYYIVRAVNDFAAAAVTNEATARTQNDATAPTAPNNLQYRGSTSRSVSLRWSAATDAAGVKRYDIFANGAKVLSTTATSATVQDLDSLTNYTFTVKAVDLNDNVSQPSNQVVAHTHRQGTLYKYYQGTWTALPNFDAETPLKEGVTTDVSIGTSIRSRSDNYGLRFDGYLYIPVTGSYTIGVRSDDGSKLFIDQDYSFTETPTVSNDGLHGATTVLTTLNLTQGYHRITTVYFEATSSESLELRWRSADAGINSEERIPSGFLSRDNPGMPEAAAAPSGLNAAAVAFNKISLNWTDNSGGLTSFEITRATAVAGTYAAIATVTAGETTFIDSTVTANRDYWYKIRSVSNAAQSVYVGPATARTLVAPATPTSPNNATATLLDRNVIRIAFNDRATNETGYEIQRSVGNTNAFRKIAELGAQAGGQITFQDSSLFSNVTYYYRVRAIGVGNFSGFSNTVNARTGNQRPKFEKILNFSVKYGTTQTLNVVANDPDGDALTFQYINLPAFATVQEVANGNVNLVFSPRMPNQGSYTLRVIADDGNNGKDTVQFMMSVNSNSAPVLADIPTVTLKEGETVNIPFSATDNGGTSKMLWNVKGMPSFATFSNTTTGTATMTVNPWFAHSGTYPTTIIVNDGAGAFTTKTFNIVVENVDTTVNDGTTPVKALGLKAEAVSNSGIRLTWEDRAYNESNYEVYRSTTAGGTYSLVNTGVNLANKAEFLDEAVAPFTTYYYYIVGVNAAGTGIASDTVNATTANKIPVVSAIADITLKANTTTQINFTVNDDAGDVVTVTIKNKPSFINLEHLGGSDYRLNVTPGVSNTGWYNITVVANDDKGGSASRTFALLVSDNKVRSVFVNLGTTVVAQPWNNWSGAGTANSSISNLVDETKAATSFGITSLSAWADTNQLGHVTGNNSGVYPDSVLASGILETSTSTKQMRFTGLNPAMRYNLVFVGSMNEGLDSRTEYRLSGSSNRDTLQARYNVRSTANLNNLTPNASGQITVDIRKLSGTSTSSYLNGITIEEFAPADVLMAPNNLYAEPIDRNSVRVNWSDRLANENVADGYQLDRATDAAFTSNLVTVDLPGNTTEYVSAGLTDNTRYFYRVRGKSGSAFTDYSNVAQTITPRSIVYVNFNFNTPSAASPWNNLESSPSLEESFPNLIDQSTNNSGITLSIVSIFNGENNLGRRTGNNSGVVPDNVLGGVYWLDKTQLSQMKLSGLNPSRRYRIGFIGSMGPGWFKGDYTATYTIGDRTVYLNAWENTSKVVYIGDVAADENGEVMLNFSTTEAALYGFNAGLIIQSYDDVPGGGTVLSRMNSDNNNVQIQPSVRNATASEEVKMPVRVYPNPFSNDLRIDFYNNSSSNLVSVELYDMSGRLAYRRNFGQVAKGANTLRFNPGDGRLRTGVYMVTLSVNGKSIQTGKIVKTQ